MLGTLVELGIALPAARPPAWARAALDEGWQAVATVEAAMSAFLPDSDVARFNRAKAGSRLEVRRETATVLRAAAALQRRSGGLFDVTLGTGPGSWSMSGRVLVKGAAAARLDLGGIAKGHAVDLAVERIAAALAGRAGRMACWANAGGDLAVRGAVEMPVHLRDEEGGGARPWLLLRQGAVATSHFSASPGRLCGGPARARHVSVVGPRCLDCDALTKVVGLSGRTDHPAVLHLGGHAWIHP